MLPFENLLPLQQVGLQQFQATEERDLLHCVLDFYYKHSTAPKIPTGRRGTGRGTTSSRATGRGRPIGTGKSVRSKSATSGAGSVSSAGTSSTPRRNPPRGVSRKPVVEQEGAQSPVAELQPQAEEIEITFEAGDPSESSSSSSSSSEMAQQGGQGGGAGNPPPPPGGGGGNQPGGNPPVYARNPAAANAARQLDYTTKFDKDFYEKSTKSLFQDPKDRFDLTPAKTQNFLDRIYSRTRELRNKVIEVPKGDW